MKKEEFIKGLKYLGIVYNKEFDQQQAEVWYDFFKDYDYETFKNAIKESVKTNKFLPNISVIIELCNKHKQDNKLEIIKKMEKDGYFKSGLEYEKAINWFNKGIIPYWFKEDMEKYTTKQLGNTTLVLSVPSEEEINDLEKRLNEIRSN